MTLTPQLPTVNPSPGGLRRDRWRSGWFRICVSGVAMIGVLPGVGSALAPAELRVPAMTTWLQLSVVLWVVIGLFVTVFAVSQPGGTSLVRAVAEALGAIMLGWARCTVATLAAWAAWAAVSVIVGGVA